MIEITPYNEENSYEQRLSCSKETKNLLLKDCTELYLRHHPEHREIKLSQGFILKKVVKFYLESP